jgi:hypothetical protein
MRKAAAQALAEIRSLGATANIAQTNSVQTNTAQANVPKPRRLNQEHLPPSVDRETRE